MRKGLMLIALTLAASLRAQTPPRFRAGMFGDVIFRHDTSDGRSFFQTAELDPYAAFRFSDRWSLVGEGLLQHVRRGQDVDEPSKHFEIDLERLYVAYSHSDRLRLELGQMHTGIVAWNQREHRSRFLQTPIDVPSIARGEEQGGAWPSHFVGIWADGRRPGPAGFAYGAGIGETRGSSRDEVQPLIRAPGRPALLVTGSFTPDAVAGLDFGISGYSGHIPAADGRLRETDATLSASYVRSAVEIRSEWAEMRHERAIDGRRFATHGWYALASYRLRTFRPYLLIDRLDVARGESYLREVRDEDAAAGGVRWDAKRWLAVKGDIRSKRTASGDRQHEFRLQLAFSFR